MSVPADLGAAVPTLAVAAGMLLLVPLLWLARRLATAVFLVALASLALRPDLLWGGPAVGYAWGLHHTLLVIALAANALRYGVYRTVNWPILALLVTFALGLAFGDLHPRLTLPFMMMSLALLALPFTFTQVVLAPGSRRAYALLIALLPLGSVAIGALLQLGGVHEMVRLDAPAWYIFRLEGATGNAGVFATLAFAGFAVALHEATRPGRPWAGPLAVINLALVILSGSRMGIFASGVFLAIYLALSEDLRMVLRRRRVRALIGAGLVAAAFLLYWPTLEARLLAGDTNQIALSGRGELWTFYWQEFLFSPWFGRGLGAGFIAGEKWFGFALPTPHHEYLHLLVVGGVVGFALVAGAIVLWYRQILQIASPNDRGFLLAVAPALAVYALTDNVLVYSSALALYAYLGVVSTLPSPNILMYGPDSPPGPASDAAGRGEWREANRIAYPHQ